jgi:hypothetical protein
VIIIIKQAIPIIQPIRRCKAELTKSKIEKYKVLRISKRKIYFQFVWNNHNRLFEKDFEIKYRYKRFHLLVLYDVLRDQNEDYNRENY